ncbi:hypothetical protein MLD38_028451 [Melastoma candidum]|uniref:Uncharacterized protein n=1 Tax=Melastoma candidum TaxID=119954 RepID=A0ACB9N0S3_9MYRT|nr:hypothetical protein MLD38_028451 [Melastoma candidum]
MAKDTAEWWMLAIPAFLGSKTLAEEPRMVILSLVLAFISLAFASWALSPGGFAWRNLRDRRGPTPIPGARGLPMFGSLFALSRGLPHRALASIARRHPETRDLLAFSLGSTPVVVSSDPHVAREILTSPHFADRPIKASARSLMFGRAMGFAPNGTYWRLLRRIASSHLFSPRRISAHQPSRAANCGDMLLGIAADQLRTGSVRLRDHLQLASLNNIMGSVFGKTYNPVHDALALSELNEMVREGFEILGAFNWSDHLPWLDYFYDPFRIKQRCDKLVPRVRRFVQAVIDDHRKKAERNHREGIDQEGDFVDVLLSLDGDEKLQEDDMVAVLWEMIFRGTDTTALLTEWAMAELILHPGVQRKLRAELDSAGPLSDADLARLPFLQAVVKEALRVHPPGPLLSWARLSTSDVALGNGMAVPAGTTTMINMWAITHDPAVWENPDVFNPERFLGEGKDVDVRGSDLRLAPFGAGRRVCPGKNLGMVTVARWVAELVRGFEWAEDPARKVDLGEVLKLSCEMKNPLHAVVAKREVIGG